MHRFIPIYAAQQGARVDRDRGAATSARMHGKTKYGLGRVPKVFLDLLLVQFLWRYGTKPMHVFGKFGLVNIFLSLRRRSPRWCGSSSGAARTSSRRRCRC